MMVTGKKPGKLNTRRFKTNKFVTRSGKTIKIRRTISEKAKASKEAKALRKAERLKGLPKSRVKRFFFRLHPKRQFKYWFSRDGAIMALKITGIGIVIGFFTLIGIFAYFRKDLPNLRDVSGDTIGGSIRFYDKTGSTLLWEDYDTVKRISVKDEDIAQIMKDATVAVEDREFFNHGGFDVKGITRAAWNNAFGGSTQGGSTITQQLVKLTTPGFSNERTLTRKVKELILSVELERSYSKQEILTGYLNAAPYGSFLYGVEVASRTYFQKSAKDLTADEAAFLASIPQSPAIYGPYSQDLDREAFVGRQHFILDVLAETGKITNDQKEEAKKVDTFAKVKPLQSKYAGIVAPWFVLAAKDQLLSLDEIGKAYNHGGYKVITTLDLDLQKIAEEEVKKGLVQVRRQRGDTAAFVAEDVKTGQVVALVGGAEFGNEDVAGELNYATQPLPPGSSFKPYDYLALIEHTNTAGAGSVLYDTQGSLEGYTCPQKCLKDYDKRYPGPVTLRYGLGASRNVPAVKAMLAVGVEKTIETANTLGLKDSRTGAGGYKCFDDEELKVEAPCYGSSAIGDGAYLNLDRHVHAYSTISRNGNRIPQAYILKVQDIKDKVVYEWKESSGEQVVRADSAYIVADMMSDPRASYMGRKIHNYKGHKFSVKTGTTNDSKDGWMMGFSTHYSAGVWVGYHTRRQVMTGFMETMTQPIWNGFMTRAHDAKEKKPEERSRPSGVKVLPAFVIKNHVGGSTSEPSPSTDLFPSWYEKPNKKPGEKKVIDQVSGKLATECTPDLAKKETEEGDAATYSTDPFVGGANSTEDKDDVHKCDDVKPSVTLTINSVGVDEYEFVASVTQGTHAWSSDKFKGSINFKVDGEILSGGSFEVNSNGTFTYPSYAPDESGPKTITVEVTDSALYSGSASETYEFVVAINTQPNFYYSWLVVITLLTISVSLPKTRQRLAFNH
jgi:membrane peptidoglycan carboxypeptidase